MQRHFLIWENPRDAVIWITLLLLAIGCINVFSASFVEATDMFGDGYFYLKRYIIFAVIGFAVMLWLGLRGPDYHLWLSKHWLNIIYFTVLVLLIAVETVGVTTKGAQRWLYVGPISIQPSELAKLAVIMLCAGHLGRRLKQHLRPALFDYPANKAFIMSLIYGALVLVQPDMGTASIVVALCVGMYILGGLPIRMLAMLMAVGFAGVVALIAIAPYRLQRILVWFDPWSDPSNAGYQMVQSLISIGSGGVLGAPWGQGSGKFFYLPEAHTDFAFAIYCQEWGFFGALFLIFLFALLGIALFKMAAACRDEEGFMLISGVTLLVVGQAAANMLMVCGCLPVIGVPLSFISYGGTSMVVSLTALGLALSVYKQEVKREKREEMLREAGMPPIMPTSTLRNRGWRS